MTTIPTLRVMGYTAFLTMYITNIYYMDWHSRKLRNTTDERLLAFKDLRNRFFTTWTFMIQIGYMFFALLCDIYILRNLRKRAFVFPKLIAELREVIFTGIVWPTSFLVATIFWGLYNYDRALIFPEYLDAVLPNISNHIIHTMIIPMAVFESLLRPRIESDHLFNLFVMTVYILLYLIVLIFTYKERDVWLYPLFEKLYGTIYFIVLLGIIYGMLIIFYCIQWLLLKRIDDKGVYKKVS